MIYFKSKIVTRYNSRYEHFTHAHLEMLKASKKYLLHVLQKNATILLIKNICIKKNIY